MSFASLGLSAPLLKAVAEQGYDTPSPIQSQAIPAVLEGRDVMAAAQTGTGPGPGIAIGAAVMTPRTRDRSRCVNVWATPGDLTAGIQDPGEPGLSRSR